MATILSDKKTANYPAKSGITTEVMTAIADVPATLAAADEIKMLDVQAGTVLLQAWLESTDLDTHGTPTVVLDLGISGGDTDYFIDGSTIGQTGGKDELDANRSGYIFTEDSTISVTCATAGATKAAGKISLICIVSMQSQDALDRT